MLESEFKPKTLKRIEEMFPGCFIEHNSTDYITGVPDTTIYWGKRWAKLEFKRSKNARRQPNQPYYVAKFDKMSFCRFVSPENVEEVLRDLQQTFQPRRVARLVKPKQPLLGELRRGEDEASLPLVTRSAPRQRAPQVRERSNPARGSSS